MLARLPPDQRADVLALAKVRLAHRPSATWKPEPHQVPPDGSWNVWLMLGGRGAGKTAAGAHYVDAHALGPACLVGITPHRMAIVAPSHEDVVNTCVRGETGLLSANPRIRFRPGASKTADLTWTNGAEAALFGTFGPEDVERFRGPQHCLVWGDEFAAWRKLDEVWDMIAFGLRLGPHPRTILTTTPKRRAKLRELLGRSDVVVSRATTRDNPHLPLERREELYRQYAGTTIGRQELDAEILEEIEGALWTRDLIDLRHIPLIRRKGQDVPDLARVVVAVDPAVTSGPDSDETGIIVAGLGEDARGYVMDDLSSRSSPVEWARRAVQAYHDYGADRIVAEANQGGDLVKTVIAAVDPLVPITLVHASKGKKARAEPIAALYEQGRISHIRPLPVLEDQMVAYTGAPGEDSPDRLDALVWGLTELFGVQTDNQIWGVGGRVWGA